MILLTTNYEVKVTYYSGIFQQQAIKTLQLLSLLK